MTGKGRGRGFTPNYNFRSLKSGGAPASSSGGVQDSVPGSGSYVRFSAPLGAEGGEKRKSDVISPLLPVNGGGRKRGEPGRACAGETVRVDPPRMDLGNSVPVSGCMAGVDSVSDGLVAGTITGFQSPLFWSNPECSLHTRFNDTSTPPYIVLLESRIPGKNLGRFNLIAMGDLIDSLLGDTKRQIFPNGRNQAKVFCDRWQAANVLVDSPELRDFGVQAYIPASLVQRKAFARNIPVEYSASDLSTRLDSDTLSNILSIRRRTLDDGSASDRVEFVFSTINIPGKLSLSSVVFDLTPVITPPKRCFFCQRFRHISEQCRSTGAVCEYCSEEHPSRDCPNTNLSPRCINCGDKHPAYSRSCPIYQLEFAVMKERTLKNCGYEEAEDMLLSRGITKPLFSVEAWRWGRGYSLGADAGGVETQSEGGESVSAGLVAEILMSIAPPVSAPTVLTEGEGGP